MTKIRPQKLIRLWVYDQNKTTEADKAVGL